MIRQTGSYNKQLRKEFDEQRIGGIPDYYQWLVNRLQEAEREADRNAMAAQINFDLWQKTESDNERITATLDSVRSWLDEKGYSLAVRVIDGMLE